MLHYADSKAFLRRRRWKLLFDCVTVWTVFAFWTLSCILDAEMYNLHYTFLITVHRTMWLLDTTEDGNGIWGCGRTNFISLIRFTFRLNSTEPPPLFPFLMITVLVKLFQRRRTAEGPDGLTSGVTAPPCGIIASHHFHAKWWVLPPIEKKLVTTLTLNVILSFVLRVLKCERIIYLYIMTHDMFTD